ncbi:hypothetical protein AVEN_139564-1, partial [Araneus ventricosus]
MPLPNRSLRSILCTYLCLRPCHSSSSSPSVCTILDLARPYQYGYAFATDSAESQEVADGMQETVKGAYGYSGSPESTGMLSVHQP